MKTKRSRALACLGVLILGIVLIMGCGGGVVTPTTEHFAESGISFDYPGTWDKLPPVDPARLAYFSELETGTVVQVITGALPSGYTLKDYHDTLVLQLMEGEPISEKSLTVSGVPASETVFNGKSDNKDWRWRVVSLEKDGTIYSIVFATAPASFDEVNEGFDTVVNSFQVQ